MSESGSRKPPILLIAAVAGVAGLFMVAMLGLWVWIFLPDSSWVGLGSGGGLSQTDRRIGVDIEAALTAHLSGLGPGDPVYDRYGSFTRLSNVSVTRPNYAWKLVERLDFSATAHFAHADALLSLGITHGSTPAITRLETHPSPQWRAANPQQAGTLQKVGNELWQVAPNSQSRCTIDGWAVHPSYTNP